MLSQYHQDSWISSLPTKHQQVFTCFYHFLSPSQNFTRDLFFTPFPLPLTHLQQWRPLPRHLVGSAWQSLVNSAPGSTAFLFDLSGEIQIFLNHLQVSEIWYLPSFAQKNKQNIRWDCRILYKYVETEANATCDSTSSISSDGLLHRSATLVWFWVANFHDPLQPYPQVKCQA